MNAHKMVLKELARSACNILASMDGIALMHNHIYPDDMEEICSLAEELGLTIEKQECGDVLIMGGKEELWTLIVRINHRVLPMTTIA